MIVLTFPSWWAFIGYFLLLGFLGYFAGRLGDRAGRALHRRRNRRKTARAQDDTLRV